MTNQPTNLVPRYCPRCGGLMIKPLRSTLYWHAESNHPRCDITNLPDPLPQPSSETTVTVSSVIPVAGSRKPVKSKL